MVYKNHKFHHFVRWNEITSEYSGGKQEVKYTIWFKEIHYPNMGNNST